MLRFRVPNPHATHGAVTDLLAVGQMIDDALQPGHFFAAPEQRLTWIAARSESVPWEIFRGRLLDAAQTREQKSFLSWHVVQDSADESLISVKLDVRERQIHVTRGLLTHTWEACDTDGGIDSRATIKWLHELVGTITLDDYADLESVHDELICLLWQAAVGTSRLPLTSVESPLPAFVFGQLHYLYQADPGETAGASWQAWLRRGLRAPCAWRETVKLVEFTLRHIAGTEAEMRRLNEVIRADWPFDKSMADLLRAMFNHVSLSPYTGFVDNALAFADSRWSFDGLLRQLCRHLTAYDLVTFHHRGANYPDALLLDAALKRFVIFIASRPSLYDADDAQSRRLRRALRQACLTRRHYEGHLVPDAPTSPGENARVMPASHPRVPEEQLTQTTRRRRQLFVDEPLAELLTESARWILAQSVRDLEHLDERVEMGLGLFIDRPLGYGKEIGEPDLTPLLAHEAFSPSIARRRWRELKKLCEELAIPCAATVLDGLFENGPWPTGLPHAALAECPRPTAALADVRKVADDFVILRTLPGGLNQLLRLFDLGKLSAACRLRFLSEAAPRLCVQALDDAQQPVLAVFDADGRRRLELRVDPRQGYATRAGMEWPRGGLQVLAVWEDTDDPAVLVRCNPVDVFIEAIAGSRE